MFSVIIFTRCWLTFPENQKTSEVNDNLSGNFMNLITWSINCQQLEVLFGALSLKSINSFPLGKSGMYVHRQERSVAGSINPGLR
jgi:hypothetical protein